MRPKLLDLFCGAGGCAAGYAAAGFDVTGVDIRPQPHWPKHLPGVKEFRQADAMEYLSRCGKWFDAIHASPPCQRYSKATKQHGRTHEHPDMVAHVRAMLLGYAVPWVMENVEGSPLGFSILLCGSSFGLRVRRHRRFESSDLLMALPCEHRRGVLTVNVCGHAGGRSVRDAGIPRHTTADWKAAMDIDWMTGKELAQAIPPAYTEFVGRQLMNRLANVS